MSMSEQTATRSRPQGAPSVFQTARDLYGAAFEPKTRAQVGDAMADWSELSEEERSFAIGHLLYLNLQAQAGSIRTLREIRDVLEDTDEAVQAMADELMAEEDEGEEPDGDEAAPEGIDDDGLDTELRDEALALPEPETQSSIRPAAAAASRSDLNDDAAESLPREESTDER
jgi:hypothetical protein